tara:strand:+ start:307 stop:468 length:162 start_codon:yes stop_codon:yes gene_type:complete
MVNTSITGVARPAVTATAVVAATIAAVVYIFTSGLAHTDSVVDEKLRTAITSR